jgi:surface protein
MALCLTTTFAAKAGTPEVYSVYDGDTTLTYYYDDQRSSHIGNEVAELYVPSQPRFANYCDKIKRAVIDPSMKNANLQSIAAMFFGWNNNALSALKTIDGMANLVTIEVTDMQYVFCDCASLDSIDLSHFYTTNVTNMRGLFCRCSALKKLDLSTFNTVKVQYMQQVFSGCESLDSLDLSNFITKTATGMQSMFYQCKALRFIDLSSFNTSNVENMSAMFESCQALDTLDLSHFDTRKVTSMNTMFSKCTALKSLDISQFEPAASCDLGWMFLNCSALNSIYCYKDWRTINNLNSQYMFTNCTAITGGKGTTYDSSLRTHEMAHVDGGSTDPGYFTTYELKTKADIKADLESKLMPGDNAECRQIIADAKDAVDALEWDGAKSVEENIAILDPKIQKILTDTDAALAAARLAAGMESVRSSNIRTQKLIRDGQIFILRDGKTFNALGAEVR